VRRRRWWCAVVVGVVAEVVMKGSMVGMCTVGKTIL
jgi:hypothetical protein